MAGNLFGGGGNLFGGGGKWGGGGLFGPSANWFLGFPWILIILIFLFLFKFPLFKSQQ